MNVEVVINKEFRIPIANREVFNDGGQRHIFCVPRSKVRIEEAYVDGDRYPLEKPVVVQPNHTVHIPLPAQRANKYTKASVCGVFAAGLDDKDKEVSRFPIAAMMMGEIEPCDFTISPMAATAGRFTPAPHVACRFKRFEVAVTAGDLTKLVLDKLSIGKEHSVFGSVPGPAPVDVTPTMPFAMVICDGALSLPTILAAGEPFSFVLSNLSQEPITIAGSLVFETAVEPKPNAIVNNAARN